MLKLPEGNTNDSDKVILRKLRVWIFALAVACLTCGVGLGALLAGRPAIAQNDAASGTQTAQQIARAPEALSASFAEIAKRVEPAVVNIETVSAPVIARRDSGNSNKNDAEKPDAEKNDKDKTDKNGEEETDENADEESNSDNPLLELYRRQLRQAPRGVGSGFIVDPKGYILTNQHVVEGATTITVKLQTGERLRGRVLGIDEETDLAVVKVDSARELPIIKLGNSDDTQVGDWVLAIGSPFGLEQTVTAGIISTKDRVPENAASGLVRFIQTDAAINRGNSGGPLVNMRGEVIGVNSQIATTTGDYNGIGFALPSNDTAFVYRQLIGEGNRVRRGYLGIVLQPVRSEFAKIYGLAEAKGAIVVDIPTTDAPAPRAGIQIGDVITEFNGQTVADSQDLINKVSATPVGSTVQLTYLRETDANGNGKLERRTASIALGERPVATAERRASRLNLPPGHPSTEEPAKPVAPSNATPERPRLGLRLSELTPQLANEKNLRGTRGLLIRDVEDGGLADSASLVRNMVIQRINRVSVNSMGDFERVISALKPGDAIVMNVARSDGERIVQTVVQFTFQ